MPTVGERNRWQLKNRGGTSCLWLTRHAGQLGKGLSEVKLILRSKTGLEDEGVDWKEAVEHVRTGPHYLEGWLGNEAVEITNRGGDIHGNGPLLLRWGFGELWQGYNCGCFLEKLG